MQQGGPRVAYIELSIYDRPATASFHLTWNPFLKLLSTLSGLRCVPNLIFIFDYHPKVCLSKSKQVNLQKTGFVVLAKSRMC